MRKEGNVKMLIRNLRENRSIEQAYHDRCIKRIQKLGSVNGIRGIVGKGTVLKILSEELENQKTK